MKTAELTLPVTLICSECGEELEAEVVQISGGNYKVIPAQFVVKPCERCMEKSRRDGMEVEREAHE